MENKEKIAIIVVTYNRKDLLLKCLHGILNQDYIVEKIFLIDNNSNDGTDKMIQQNFLNNKKIVYKKLKENTGGAGGFHEGVKIAFETGFDWFWLMDDDVTPEKNCLRKMLEYKEISKCIHPHEYDVNGNEFIWEQIFDPHTGRAASLENISFKNGKDYTFVNVGCFEGMLIHRDIVANIGLPDTRFFISSDDTIYGFVASMFTNVIYVKDAILTKLIPLQKTANVKRFYYLVRNQFLIKEYLKKYNLYRNKVFYLNLLSLMIVIGVKQSFISKSIKPFLYSILGLFHGLIKKFYK